MAVLHQFDYIFAFGVIFAFLDAWNIGANDVANSFATSVSSRSLTLPQAMIIATFTEFLGAVLAGYVACATPSWTMGSPLTMCVRQWQFACRRHHPQQDHLDQLLRG